MERRLTAVLAADAVGYSRLMEADEEAALAMLASRRIVIDRLISEHGGRIFGSAGDSVLAEFTSSVEAVRCAIEIQKELEQADQGVADAERMQFRIGINFGDVILEDDNVFGDGVNVAARLEGLAPAGGVCVSGQVAEQVASSENKFFANAGRHKLKNISKPVEVWCWPPEDAGTLRRASAKWPMIGAMGAIVIIAAAVSVYYVIQSRTDKLALTPSGPRIAVIPFSQIGDDVDDAYFSDGLTKDINAQLSKFSNLFVIAPSSTREFGDKANCQNIRKALNADYVLEGTVRRSQNDLRVTTSLTDAATCRQLDAPGPFDRDLSVASVLDVQLEIAKKVVAEVGSSDAPLFNAAVQSAIRRKAPESLASYECVLLSYWFYETFAPDRHRRARSCLENAVKVDGDYSLGWSRLAFSYIESKKYSIDTPSDWAELSRSAANRALDLDPDNPDAYYALAILSQMTREDHTVFQNFAKKAIELNPNDAFVLADLGTWMGYSGQWEQGKEWVSRSKLLNPKHQSWLDYIWHLHHYLKGEYAQARDVALKVNLPDNYMVQASLTAAYAMNGEQAKAKQTLSHVLKIRPDYPKDPRAPFRTRRMPPELIDRLMAGLGKAGLDVPPAPEEK